MMALAGRPHAVSGGDDGTLRVWDLTTGRQVGQELVFWRGPSALAVGAGNRIVVASGTDIAVLTRRRSTADS